jgi:hypothetical protein
MSQVLELSQYKCTSVNRAALGKVVMPEPTETYQPIRHDWLLNQLEAQISDIGLTFGGEHHGLSHNGQRYFGVINLVNGEERDGYSIMMGLRNSLDKRFAAQVAFGNTVMVCANLCFWGTYMLGRKHTPNIMEDLPDLITATLQGIPDMIQLQDSRIEAYRTTKLGGFAADHLIVEMLRHKALNTSRVEKVVKEWDNPSYDHGEKTVWRMHNAVTEALKGVNIHEMPQRTIALQHVCDEFVGFKEAA